MTTIDIVPWPVYTDGSRTPIWEVRIEAPKFRGTLRWSVGSGRFVKDNHIFRLRRGSPKVYRSAVNLMREFCSKPQQLSNSEA